MGARGVEAPWRQTHDDAYARRMRAPGLPGEDSEGEWRRGTESPWSPCCLAGGMQGHESRSRGGPGQRNGLAVARRGVLLGLPNRLKPSLRTLGLCGVRVCSDGFSRSPVRAEDAAHGALLAAQPDVARSEAKAKSGGPRNAVRPDEEPRCSLAKTGGRSRSRARRAMTPPPDRATADSIGAGSQ